MTITSKPNSSSGDHEAPEKPIIAPDLKTASDELKARLAEKRAIRREQWSRWDVPHMEEPGSPSPVVPTPATVKTNTVLENTPVRVAVAVAQPPPAMTPVITPPLPSPRLVITQDIRVRVEAMRSEIDQLLPDLQTGKTPLTTEDIMESIETMQAQEEQWETLPISEIKIPRQEISIWSGFMKILNQGFTERAFEPKFEKWDIYELKIQKFDFFRITRIRKSEKDSLTFCVVQSQINGQPNAYTFEVLVRLPIREGQMLEVYLNRDKGPELINQWKIEQVFLRKNPEERKKKGGIFKILGI